MIPQPSNDNSTPEIIRFPQATPAQPPAGPSLADLVPRYVKSGQLENKWDAKSLAERQRALTEFMHFEPEGVGSLVGPIPAEQLKPYFLKDWIESHESWRSSSTRKGKANAINACLNWAVAEGRIARNPLAKVNYAEAPPRPPMPDVTLGQIAFLCTQEMEWVVRFLRLVFCRQSDVCRANWEDVDWQKQVIVLQEHKSRKKTGKAKTLILVKEAVDLLRTMQAEQRDLWGEPTGPIFRNTKGRRWRTGTLGQNLLRLLERHDIATPARLHGIRHQAATVAIQRGESLKLVSEMLGHASAEITQKIYLHMDSDESREAIRQMAERSLATPALPPPPVVPPGNPAPVSPPLPAPPTPLFE